MPPKFLIDRANDVQVVFDLGAYGGYTALDLADVFPRALVVAVEADPETYKLLCRNAERCARIFPINAAVWDADVDVFFNQENAPNGRHVQALGGLVVPGRSVASIREELGFNVIDYVKMDIEGSEEAVSRTDLSFVQCINVEVHFDFTDLLTVATNLAKSGIACSPHWKASDALIGWRW